MSAQNLFAKKYNPGQTGMIDFQKGLDKILSHRNAGLWVLLFIAIIKFIQLNYLYYLRPDMSYQIISAHSLIYGFGISEPISYANDLSDVQYVMQFKWPPGYAILFSPIYVLLGENHFLSALVFNYIFSVLLIIINRKILRLFDTKESLINAFTIITGLALFYLESEPSTDAIAVPLFMTAAYFGLWIIRYREKYFSSLSAMTSALLLAASVKYLFIPIVFLLPVFLLIIGIQKKDRKLMKGSILSFISLALILGGILLWQKINSGNMAYLQQTTRGFYINNILEFHPFIPASIIKLETLHQIIYWLDFRNILVIMQVLHLAALALATYYIFRKKGLEVSARFIDPGMILRLTWLIAAGITVQLLFLSLFVKAENDIKGIWTYIEEARYYGALTVLIHLSIFIKFSYYRSRKNRFASRFFVLIIILLLPEAFRGFIFSANRIRNFATEEYMWEKEKTNETSFKQLIEEQEAVNGNRKIIVCGSSNWITWKTGLFSMRPVLKDFKILNESEKLKTSEPALLIFILDTVHKDQFISFTNKHSKDLKGLFNRWKYYAIPVDP